MAEATAGAAEAAVPENKKKSPIVLILAVAVATLAAGGGGAWFFLGKNGGEKGAGAHAEDSAKSEPKAVEKGVLSLEPFIVNLADADVDRYVKCTVRLVVDTQATAEKVKSQELAVTRVRDRILTLLSGKKFAEVATPEGKEALRDEIAAAVGEVLETGKITAVYYTEFIVQ